MNDEQIDTRLKALMDDAGIADYFFCGVLLNGVHIRGVGVGHYEAEYSNVERRQRLMGVVEEAKAEFLMNIFRPIKDEGSDL